jgi:hypothetical protein
MVDFLVLHFLGVAKKVGIRKQQSAGPWNKAVAAYTLADRTTGWQTRLM